MNFIKGAVKKKTEAYISVLDCCVLTSAKRKDTKENWQEAKGRVD